MLLNYLVFIKQRSLGSCRIVLWHHACGRRKKKKKRVWKLEIFTFMKISTFCSIKLVCRAAWLTRGATSVPGMKHEMQEEQWTHHFTGGCKHQENIPGAGRGEEKARELRGILHEHSGQSSNRRWTDKSAWIWEEITFISVQGRSM